MGKLVTYLSILIFIDILFLITGQLDISSGTSVITGAILDPSAFKTSVFFLIFLGVAGIAGLLATSGVTTGTLVTATNVLAFILMATAMIGLLGDFITVFVYLNSQNPVLAKVVMAPIIMLFAVTIAEWLRGKD
ncbi:hypothetical protein LCGC14_0439570 [marine sediment metagenome]|uniref:Uncharacterized protein n=1 Tax=marine sediment metagenome TaxID=412755 RepID=A0A0F9SRV7_9ZZZZ